MASALGVPLQELISNKPRFFRYAILLFRTTHLLWRYRGKHVFVQNPSIVLAFWAVCLKPVLRCKVIVDFHNSGLFPLEGRSRLLLSISRFICRRANLSIVTNTSLARVVKERGGEPSVVTDPLNEEEFSSETNSQSMELDYFLFVCSWAEDEPWEEVLKAVTMTENPVKILVTGNYKRCLSEKDISTLPEGVKLLGFIDREDYIGALQGARLMVDLTTRDHCLVCGAYEAVAAEVPMLLTDTVVNREVFYSGAVYTANDAKSIAEALDRANENYSKLKRDVRTFRSEYRSQSNQQIDGLKVRLLEDSDGVI